MLNLDYDRKASIGTDLIAYLGLIDNDTKSPNSSSSMRPAVAYKIRSSAQTLRQIDTAPSSRYRLHCWVEKRASSRTNLVAVRHRGLLLSVVGIEVVLAAVLVVLLLAGAGGILPRRSLLKLV